MVKWGSVFLLALAWFLSFEQTAKYVSDLEIEVDALRAQRAALIKISEAPDVTEHMLRLSSQIEQLESRYFNEATIGTNSASLQTLLTKTLSECGLENLSISISHKASEKDLLSGTIVASIKASDRQKQIAICLSMLKSSQYAFEIVSLNWMRTGPIQMDIRAFYLPPRST